MNSIRIALANIRFPSTADESVELAVEAINAASDRNAAIICFPECYVPGYRLPGSTLASPDPELLDRAWSMIANAAGSAGIGVVLGTERIVDDGLCISALVIDRDGSVLGFQDKVQLDPSEESTYVAGNGRHVFRVGSLVFGITICHEGWRYPETVRWAARHGAHVFFHPHFHEAEPDTRQPTEFGDPRNTFHEKAALCRAVP